MKKRWLVLPIALLAIVLFWQLDGFEFVLSRTVFAPDYTEGMLESEPESVAEPEPETIAVTEERIYSGEELGYEVEIIAQGLEIPWEIVPTQDGRIFVTERPGRIMLIDHGLVHTLFDVEDVGEGGLLGMALSPYFEEDHQVFLYYTYRSGNQILNRVSSYILEGNTFIEAAIILDNIPGARFHNGGRIKFGPDEKLYVATGDAVDPGLSQDLDSLAGKILRLNPDGTVPDDNPFEDSLVFAYGLRNPQGLAWHPVSGDLYASDHGPDSQDEINRILAGKNYGWPLVTCRSGESAYEDPVACYSEFTLAPSGMAFLPWHVLEEPALFVAGLRGNMVMRLDLDNEGTLVRQSPLFDDYGRIRTVVYFEGALYIATNNGDGRGIRRENDDKIFKITPILP